MRPWLLAAVPVVAVGAYAIWLELSWGPGCSRGSRASTLWLILGGVLFVAVLTSGANVRSGQRVSLAVGTVVGVVVATFIGLVMVAVLYAANHGCWS